MTTEAVSPAATPHRSVLQFREKRKFNWLVLGLLVVTGVVFLLTEISELF